eukprot:1159484-Pelagomonas_calceolata.AAC.7
MENILFDEGDSLLFEPTLQLCIKGEEAPLSSHSRLAVRKGMYKDAANLGRASRTSALQSQQVLTLCCTFVFCCLLAILHAGGVFLASVLGIQKTCVPQDTPSAKMSYTAAVRVPKPLTALMSAVPEDNPESRGDALHIYFARDMGQVVAVCVCSSPWLYLCLGLANSIYMP